MRYLARCTIVIVQALAVAGEMLQRQLALMVMPVIYWLLMRGRAAQVA